MKKVVLVGINSRFTHLNPAIRSLRAMVPGQTALVEGTLQDPPQRILRRILAQSPDAVGLSGYIWNRQYMLSLARMIKAIRPDTVVFLGGPEFSFETVGFLNDHQEIDFLMPGEGEIVFRDWLSQWEESGSFQGAAGTVCRGLPFTHVPACDMADLPFPYTEEELAALAGRSVYYETSRGCPGRCAFCLSGCAEKVRYKPLATVYAELERFFAAGVGQVKLIDRTFNCDPSRAVAILDAVLALDAKYQRRGQTNVHMEVRGDTLDESFLSRIERSPEGLFRLEVGLQTTNRTTRSAIHRGDDLPRLTANVARIQTGGRAAVHLDLIAGLPFEDLQSFERSFNEAMSYGADELQLGFLKVLPGSELHALAEKYDLRFQPDPPYEILETPWLSFRDLCVLKDIEAILEWTVNAGSALTSMKRAAAMMGQGPFALFRAVAEAFRARALMDRPLSVEERYSTLYEVLNELIPLSRDEWANQLRHDWCMHGKPHRFPSPLHSHAPENGREQMQQELTEAGFLTPLLPLSAGHRARLFHIEEYDPPILVDGRTVSRIMYRYPLEKTDSSKTAVKAE